MMERLNIAWDMETSDPDDCFTLCLLACHPKVNLIAVTVTPGSKHQIGLVKYILKFLNKDIPVGARKPDHEKECVSDFHYKWLGQIGVGVADGLGKDILLSAVEEYPDLIMVCGAALGNVGALLDYDIELSKIVIQGGFAGDNIVAPEDILEKFRGRITCPTFNLNGDVKSALKILSSNKILERYFVSKNVCHGVRYDNDMHEMMRECQYRTSGLNLIYMGMDKYLKDHPDGKMFYDPLAACCAIEPSICKFEEVEMFREKGEWGARKSENMNAKISVKVDIEKFKKTIIGE